MFILVWVLVALVAVLAGLLVDKLQSSVNRAVKEDELGQTRQNEDYDGD